MSLGFLFPSKSLTLCSCAQLVWATLVMQQQCGSAFTHSAAAASWCTCTAGARPARRRAAGRTSGCTRWRASSTTAASRNWWTGYSLIFAEQ
eukprot:CAMPEP_0194705356 /NCGR_PEP_ID=MMETSP0295-20121207/28878_1 /TAXON_ID=39354 /ORGANISM="Heterosigma akashiwo, Strain CCMP2393" /LENGTH=91 /DNA_ID=CAMNT_0039601013 /DNA_START=79 /DNA_END=351 /DNA_ORIENTATION=+